MWHKFAAAVLAGLVAISVIGCQQEEEKPPVLPTIPPEFKSQPGYGDMSAKPPAQDAAPPAQDAAPPAQDEAAPPSGDVDEPAGDDATGG